MPRTSPERDIVASAPYKPPVSAATRMGGRRTVWRLASAGLLVGMTIVAGVALTGASGPQPVEVGFRAPQRPAAAAPVAGDAQLVLEQDRHRMKLVRDGEVAWRGTGPVDCVTGRHWTSPVDRSRLLATACVRLSDGAIVSLAGRVPAGAAVAVR
jgi:hypothetical protein